MSSNEEFEDYDLEYESKPGPSVQGAGRVPSVKKRKLNRACDVCRKRKGDFVELPSGTLNKCLNCFSAKVPCTFNADGKPREPTKRKQDQADREAVRANETVRQAMLEGKVDPSASKSELNRIRHEMIKAPHADATTLETSGPLIVPRPGFLDSSKGARYFVGESSESDMIRRAIVLKEEWERGQTSAPKKTPPSTKGDADAWLARRRPEFWSLPSNLISKYFETANLHLPLIHRPTFEREIQEGLHLQNDSFAVTVLLICAIGARYSTDPEVFLDETDIEQAVEEFKASAQAKDHGILEEEIDNLRAKWRKNLRHSRGWKYFEQAWGAKSSDRLLLGPTLYDIQFYSLSVLFLGTTSFPQSSWALVGIGLRLVLESGGHRQLAGIDSPNAPVEAELWKRACWVLVSMDRHLSCSTGRPCSLQDEELDLELPVECDDEHWEHPDPQLRFKQPSDKPSVITAFNLMIRINEIIGIILRTIYAVKNPLRFLKLDKKEWDQWIVTEVDSRLNTWLNSIPPHLQWDPNNPDERFLSQSGYLYTVYYHAQILLHRPFIPSPRRPATVSFPSLTICTNASRSIARINSVLSERTNNFLAFPIFIAGIVLLLKAWDSRNSGRSTGEQFKKDMEDVNLCLTLLKLAEETYFSAGKLYNLASADEHVFPPPIPRPDTQKEPTTNGASNSKNSHAFTFSYNLPPRSTIPVGGSGPGVSLDASSSRVPSGSSSKTCHNEAANQPNPLDSWPPRSGPFLLGPDDVSPPPLSSHGSPFTLSPTMSSSSSRPSFPSSSTSFFIDTPSIFTQSTTSTQASTSSTATTTRTSTMHPSSEQQSHFYELHHQHHHQHQEHHQQHHTVTHHAPIDTLDVLMSSDSSSGLQGGFSSAGIEELGISNLWDWGLPFHHGHLNFER
ncbi:nuclear protein [Coprinopsis cinerea okayama7|uniref:Nuclear protein n=1 Tax=Coprinopsis cinerea (strain Okayama-7 / 130 / ATCC MYA-4618 / FGSC 9003) TaxID=240176 RepID=A8P3N1_COPC7|nr:nuclear protein [Coprinopsis cinerea okayama7\|eukprot:XP_001838579.2 nuclear protein [Coprinopsis cinerea okayama7\